MTGKSKELLKKRYVEESEFLSILRPSRIFISGPISGRPVAETVEEFRMAAELISVWEHEVTNPMELPGIYFGIEHDNAMDICLDALKDCHAIVMLQGWEDSSGALQEFRYAREEGLIVVDFKNSTGEKRVLWGNQIPK